MNTHKIPLIKDLTLSRIGELICVNYDYAKQDLGDFIHRDERTFRRKANGTAKIFQKDVDWLIDSMIKTLYKGDEIKFYTTLKEWFPSLQQFSSQNDIRKIFTANLMGSCALNTKIFTSPTSDTSSLPLIALIVKVVVSKNSNFLCWSSDHIQYLM